MGKWKKEDGPTSFEVTPRGLFKDGQRIGKWVGPNFSKIFLGN